MKVNRKYKKVLIILGIIFFIMFSNQEIYAINKLNSITNKKINVINKLISDSRQKIITGIKNILTKKTYKNDTPKEIDDQVKDLNKDDIKELDFFYTKADTLLKTEAKSSANNLTVLAKGTKLIDLKESETKTDGTVYYKVKTEDEKLIGYVLKRMVSEDEIIPGKQNITIEEKTKIVNEALSIEKLNTVYSQAKREREYAKGNTKSGYSDEVYDPKTTYYFDCSSFCSTIYKRIFGIDLLYTDKEGNNKIWTTYQYIRDAKKKDSKFEIVQEVLKNGQQIDITEMQVGDLLIGEKVDKDTGKSDNHIMLYIGQGYIVHSTSSYELGDETTEKRTEVVKEKLDTKIFYYTKLDTEKDLLRFNKSIRVLRYKDL